MELLTPSLGLIIWTIVSFIALGTIIYAVYHLANNKRISSSDKLLWLLIILLIPIVGAVVYLSNKRTRTNKVTSLE